MFCLCVRHVVGVGNVRAERYLYVFGVCVFFHWCVLCCVSVAVVPCCIFGAGRLIGGWGRSVAAQPGNRFRFRSVRACARWLVEWKPGSKVSGWLFPFPFPPSCQAFPFPCWAREAFPFPFPPNLLSSIKRSSKIGSK